MHEEWRLTHHPDYDVSNLGRVRSRALRGGGYIRRGGSPETHQTPRILKGSLRNGYPSLTLSTPKRHYVHRLVAAAFIGPCPKGQEVRHKDDDKQNPKADNLEYGTHVQNLMDCARAPKNDRYCKLLPESVAMIRLLGSSYPQRELAKRFNTSSATISRILCGRTRING